MDNIIEPAAIDNNGPYTLLVVQGQNQKPSSIMHVVADFPSMETAAGHFHSVFGYYPDAGVVGCLLGRHSELLAYYTVHGMEPSEAIRILGIVGRPPYLPSKFGVKASTHTFRGVVAYAPPLVSIQSRAGTNKIVMASIHFYTLAEAEHWMTRIRPITDHMQIDHLTLYIIGPGDSLFDQYGLMADETLRSAVQLFP